MLRAAIIFGLLTVASTALGGLFALRRRDKLHLILGFSAGAVVGVAFFDLLPEALELAGKHFSASVVTSAVAAGFLGFMLLSRMILLHPHVGDCEDEHHQGALGAASLSLHSMLDGIGIGLAFQASNAVGLIVAAAVLSHDFSDGINTVSFVLRHNGAAKAARGWLIVDAVAPLVGVLISSLFHLAAPILGLVLAVFCGLFLHIGASDLLPESHHRHPKLTTSLATLVGAASIFLAVRLAHI